jgi:hypothetical protein
MEVESQSLLASLREVLSDVVDSADERDEREENRLEVEKREREQNGE